MRTINLRGIALFLAALGTAACGDSSPAAPEVATLDGEWTLSVSQLADTKVTCEVNGFAGVLVTRADSIVGRFDANSVPRAECTVIGGEPPFSTPSYPSGEIAGAVSGSAVSIALADSSYTFSGVRTGDTITGIARYRGTDSGGAVARVGTFRMRRIQR